MAGERRWQPGARKREREREHVVLKPTRVLAHRPKTYEERLGRETVRPVGHEFV